MCGSVINEPRMRYYVDYPVHRPDTEGILRDVRAESMMPGRIEYAKRMYSETKPDRRAKMNEELETAFSACAIDGEASQKDRADYLGVSERTVKNRIASHDGLTVKRGMVYRIGIAE